MGRDTKTQLTSKRGNSSWKLRVHLPGRSRRQTEVEPETVAQLQRAIGAPVQALLRFGTITHTAVLCAALAK